MATETVRTAGSAKSREARHGESCLVAAAQAVERLRSLDRAGREGSEAAAAALEGFAAELLEIAPRLAGALTAEAATGLGRDAARQVLSAAAWSEAVGERVDTSQAAEMLGVTRQALAKRQSSGSLIGLPGRRTTWFPTWQFDSQERRVRPVVKEIASAFQAQLGTVESAMIAAWATTPQHEDLDSATPARWIQTGGDSERVVQAALRAAARLAQ